MSSEELKAIQYFRENLDWFHSLEIDTDKLKTVLSLAEKGINLEKEKQKLEAKMVSKIKELHISDIEPWSTYKIPGKWLFDVIGYFI